MGKFSAFGTALLMDGTEIAQVTSFSGPNLSADTVDVTTHDQTTAWEEVILSILRSGELTMELVFDYAEHADLLTELVGKTYEDFELDFPDSAYTEWRFNAYVISFSTTEPVDGALTGTCTIKITGEPSLSNNYTP